MTTPDDACFRGGGGGGGGSAHAQNDGQQVLRVAPKRFLTGDEARHQQWKMLQVVHPRSTWASQDEETKRGLHNFSASRTVADTLVVEG